MTSHRQGRAHFIIPALKCLLVVIAVMTAATSASGQSRRDPAARPPWVDTTGESGVYPHGDAVDVYRAVLDLLYIDGKKRPSVIVMHDTAEGRSGDGPCPVECDRVWPHKSKMDTATVLAFARQSPKRPRMQKFAYPIPIVFMSYDENKRLRHDGMGYLAADKTSNTYDGQAFTVAFARKYPGAWGTVTLTRVGFNVEHTEALVQVGQSCGDGCHSDEVMFLKRFDSGWAIVERIPNSAEALSVQRGNLRYRGPAGTHPTESEILIRQPAGSVFKSESRGSDGVYAAVLDSLYSFWGDSPKLVVFTDRFRNPDPTFVPRKTRIDGELLQKFVFLSGVRTLPDPSFAYRLPFEILLFDSMAKVERRGVPLERTTPTGSPFWRGFNSMYPSAWGMVGFSRVAFNVERTQALVYSNHQCGPDCDNGDTWFLSRVGETWRVIERIPTGTRNNWEPVFFPLRYVGLDAERYAYRRRSAQVTFTNAVTKQPLGSLRVSTHRHTGESRVWVSDSAGIINFGRLPLAGVIAMTVGCPDQTQPDSISGPVFIYKPGRDTTVSASLDFRPCFRPPPGDQVTRPLSGAQAFISETEARLVFPFGGSSYTWDVPPKKGVEKPALTWSVWWGRADSREGGDPIGLSITKSFTPGGPRNGPLAELIAGQPLDEIFGGDGFYAVSPQTDRRNVFAAVENGKLVFVVRGRDAVRRTFPTRPGTIRFEVPSFDKTKLDLIQAVVVNCRSSGSTAASRRMCDAASGAQIHRQPSARRVHVVALSYDGASLMRHLDVRVRSEDRKVPLVVKSTAGIGKLSTVQTAPDSVTFEALCATKRGSQRKVGGRMSMYIAPGADTTLQLLVDPRACGR